MPHDTYFQGNPTRLDVSRSKMRARPRWTGSWNVGQLFPIFATSSVMPGDTFKMSIASAIRMVRPIAPVMDDMEITIEAYFVPHRLILSRKSMSPDLNDSNHSWQAFIGAQDSLLNMPTPGDVTLPTCLIAQSSYAVGGLADCLGFAVPQSSSASYYVNCLKPLAFYSIWNEYFREPNTQVPVTYSITNAGVINLTGSDAGVPGSNWGTLSTIPLPPVSRYHGYFGSALPWPQRNSNQVEMPLGDLAPLVARGDAVNPFGTSPLFYSTDFFASQPSFAGSYFSGGRMGLVGTVSDSQDSVYGQVRYASGNTLNNLYADLSTATAASVNEFRLAVQTQRWYEALARSGNKYTDLVHGMFGVRGVSIPDRPEYLGGFTAPINMSQVASTQGDAQTGSLGDTGAFSLSNPSGYLFTKSFTEHGTIMVVACCRVRDSFAQGIQREDTRSDRFDFYWPQFANLGEQPILKRELFVGGASGGGFSSTDNEVFGYQEAWAEYRMFADQVRGYLNPTVSAGIGFYTYANNFSSAPSLKGYLNASSQKDIADRTLTATSASVGFQLFGQFEFDIDMVRPMPTYSIPGLVDHH